MKKHFIFILFIAVSVHAEFKRLDPHGSYETDIKSKDAYKSDCSVCHTNDPKVGIKVKSDVVESCTTCHGSAPHSGIAEHAKHMFRNASSGANEPITCLACHSPHRYKSLGADGASHMIRIAHDAKAPLMLKTAEHPMLKRKCEDCHKW